MYLHRSTFLTFLPPWKPPSLLTFVQPCLLSPSLLVSRQTCWKRWRRPARNSMPLSRTKSTNAMSLCQDNMPLRRRNSQSLMNRWTVLRRFRRNEDWQSRATTLLPTVLLNDDKISKKKRNKWSVAKRSSVRTWRSSKKRTKVRVLCIVGMHSASIDASFCMPFRLWSSSSSSLVSSLFLMCFLCGRLCSSCRYCRHHGQSGYHDDRSNPSLSHSVFLRLSRYLLSVVSFSSCQGRRDPTTEGHGGTKPQGSDRGIKKDKH